jgi:L-seryl-tRNA(Ser) seleniumtransferase
VAARNDSRLRSLPSVHELAACLDGPPALAVAAARRAIDERRAALLAAADPGADPGADHDESPADAGLVDRARALIEELERPSLRPVLNATGVILHTNLGRAPLAPAAREAVTRAAGGYGNLELDLATGARGSRQVHVERLLTELTGAEAAIVVNNGAAAVLLAVAALAGSGRAVVVSRGQLVEIGGGFRIPEVIAQSGARMVEVGTTNRTRLADYQRALEDGSTILRVHPSNFRTVGFVEEVSIEALCGLGVPVIDDVGSGVLADAAGIPALADEPALKRSIDAGAALVCCSGDKLLGGPQAGLLLGTAAAVAAARQHPLARALRIDKLSLAALAATLALYRDPARARSEIPVLAMLDAAEPALATRADHLQGVSGAGAEVIRATGRVGGGALPMYELEGPVVALAPDLDPVAVMQALRESEPPVIARIHDGRVLLDPRTLADEDLEAVAAAVRRALDR